MNIRWYSKDDLLKSILNQIKKVDVVLDIGCGIIPQEYMIPKVHICCEPFIQYLECLKNNVDNAKDRSYVFINAGWSEVIKIFPEKSVDSIFILDVVEHLDKNEGMNLLKETEKIARKQIIVFTPLGFLPQKHDDSNDAWGLEGSEWQEHKSGWLPDDFDDKWEIYAAKEFHYESDVYVKFPEPYGAFFAIKNIKGNIELPLTSIITPVFNNEKYIEQVIKSVINQDYENIEFILLDDGSSDRSSDIIKKYENYVIYDKHEHMGEVLTINKGLSLANGEIICVVSPDAPLYLNAVSKIVESLVFNKDAVAAYPNYNIIGEDGQIIKNINTCEYDYAYMLRWHQCIPGPGTFFRRKLLEAVGGMDICFKYLADFDFWLRAGLLGKFVRIPFTLATLRSKEDVLTKNLKETEKACEHVKLIDKFYSMQNIPETLLSYKKEAYSSAYYNSLADHKKSNIFRRLYYVLKAIMYYPKNFSNGGKYKLSSLLSYLFPKSIFNFLRLTYRKFKKLNKKN
ncbi:MAG: glycosyltransferase [Candidatus Humimicrobiaceae bacterium]